MAHPAQAGWAFLLFSPVGILTPIVKETVKETAVVEGPPQTLWVIGLSCVLSIVIAIQAPPISGAKRWGLGGMGTARASAVMGSYLPVKSAKLLLGKCQDNRAGFFLLTLGILLMNRNQAVTGVLSKLGYTMGERAARLSSGRVR